MRTSLFSLRLRPAERRLLEKRAKHMGSTMSDVLIRSLVQDAWSTLTTEDGRLRSDLNDVERALAKDLQAVLNCRGLIMIRQSDQPAPR